MLIINTDHWSEAPYIPSLLSLKARVGIDRSDLVTSRRIWVRFGNLWRSGKVWTENIKEDLFPFKSLAVPSVRVKRRKLFCRTFFMNEVFVLQQMSIEFGFCSNGHSFVNCSTAFLPLVMFINGCVAVDIV